MLHRLGRSPHRLAVQTRRFGPGLIATVGVTAAGLALAPAAGATVPAPAPGNQPGAAAFASGAVTARVDMFYRQTNNRLAFKNAGGTQDLGGVLSSGASAIAKASGEFVDESVYARGSDNGVWYRDYSDGLGAWLGWKTLAGKALGTPGVTVGSSRVDLQACKLEYSIVSPK